MKCESKMRVWTYAALLVIGHSTGIAAAQTPPKSAAPTDNAIVDAPRDPSPPSMEILSSQFQLTIAQKTAILNAIRNESPSRVSPTNFTPVPPSIELHALPNSALAQVPAAKLVKYTVVQNQVVLVDPLMMRVVDILHE
jgi:hypothetical protein